MSGRWVDLREAAELLGTSTEAVRKRAARGSLRSDRRGGRVLVWVDEGRTEGGREPQVDRDAVLEAKDEIIALLRLQLEAERQAHAEARRLLMAALERIPPQLEPPVDRGNHQEAREATKMAAPPPGSVEAPPSVERSQEPAREPAQPRSRWRRVLPIPRAGGRWWF